MIFILPPALLGIWRYRYRPYFFWVGATFVWLAVGTTLFYAGGSLEEPWRDGLITRYIRQAVNDGPQMGLVAIGILVIVYGGYGVALQRMHLAATEYIKFGERPKLPVVRALAETFALLAVAAAWWGIPAYLAMQNAKPAPVVTQISPPVAQAPAKLSLEQELVLAAKAMNDTAPQKIDPSTTLVRVTAEGRTLVYHYAMSEPVKSRVGFIDYISKAVTPKACAEPDQRASMKDGVAFAYEYTAEGLTEPARFTIDEALCQSFEAAAVK